MTPHVRFRLWISALIVTTLVACSPAPEIIGIRNANVPVETVADLTKHRIFIMSTRGSSEVAGAFYSSQRTPDLGMASVDATVPPTHVVGVLERPKRLPPDPRREFTVVNPVVYSTDEAFIAGINRELAKRAPGNRKLLVFVHGFNNTASDAVLRLSQFVEDTDFQGVPVLFTWASAAKGTRYVYDLNSALIARHEVRNVAAVLNRTRAESVDIFAHSMGTFLTMEGLIHQQQTGRLGKGLPIDHIVLASPDIDIDLFRTQISALDPAIKKRVYLLISQDDAALRLSRRIAGGVPRVGAADALQLEKLGVTVIDLSKVEDSNSGSHSKFAGSPEVVRIIGSGLNSNRRFGQSGSSTTFQELLANTPIMILRN
ncbi:MAG: alpha/beta hydrolase [Roseovarius sp.]|uniref:alpha/beta hydrolase n=1 Tax=Roseovarius sp. TaxID=1486281 RepID=UPI00261DEB8F|nr:alpha/beta hydrolase [Roseovarius sp.]